MGTILYADGLTFGYPGQPPVLENIGVTIKSTERVGVVGPNGAGKTTFFLVICGILKPAAGRLETFGVEVKPGSFQPETGMVFQHTDDQLICPSVREDISFGPLNMGLDDEEVSSRVMEVAENTGITDLLDRPPHHLSSGEQRLVAMSGILAMKPRLLILDEPTSDLDIRYRRRLIRLLEKMEEQTILIASHDLEFILETCDRVLMLDEGGVQADGEASTVMSNQELMESHGLEVPHSLVSTFHRHCRKHRGA
ncbi:MAG: ABC transporter ATP-binding protein [Actinomycetota bacterium]|nr:ABC transporter ATP-binding protein [Actinomycetota bacterium]